MPANVSSLGPSQTWEIPFATEVGAPRPADGVQHPLHLLSSSFIGLYLPLQQMYGNSGKRTSGTTIISQSYYL
jgi:hypothetical protein